MKGSGGGVWANSDSVASPVLVPQFILPETRPNDVVSMHKCYIFFLVCLAWPKNVSLFALLMTSRHQMGRMRRDGVQVWEEGGGKGSHGLPSQNCAISSGNVLSG